MHILAISGSLRASSTNTTLVRAIMRLAPENMEITLYEGLADHPHFSPDLDGDEPLVAVRTLRKSLQVADGVLICTPEYAFGVPGVLKNALDWTVSSGEFWGKPVVAISASPLWSGGDKAHASLLLTLTALGANVPEGGKLMIPAVNWWYARKRELCIFVNTKSIVFPSSVRHSDYYAIGRRKPHGLFAKTIDTGWRLGSCSHQPGPGLCCNCAICDGTFAA